MAFFSRPTFRPDASFTPLFRLLDDFDKYSQGGSTTNTPSNGRRSPVFHWQPKFDVRETADAYELHGELPGLDKENVSIEFPEAQQLVIKGKVDRTYTSGTPPAGGAVENAPEKPAIADGNERRNSHQATVEDEAEAKSTEAASTTTKAEQPADKAKYWLTERSIGEFSRIFSFPSRVDQDAVSASLKDGILNVTVPKAKKHESRRIAIQ